MIQANRPQVMGQEPLHPLFVYATLMHPKTRAYVLKHKNAAQRVTLTGYKIAPYKTREGKDFDTLERTGDIRDQVHGDLLMLSTDDFNMLIKWEDLYKLAWIVLADGRHTQTFQLIKQNELQKE